MRLFLVRHGETTFNVTRVHQPFDSPLSELGKEQARLIGEKLREHSFAAVYISDMLRAKRTAEHILAHHPSVESEYRSELRERNSGVFMGSNYDIMDAEIVKQGIPFEEFRPEGGESWLDVQNRVARFFSEIKIKHPNQDVLFVAHAGVLRELLTHVFGLSHEEAGKYKISNASLSILEVSSEGKPHLAVFNDTSHLS